MIAIVAQMHSRTKIGHAFWAKTFIPIPKTPKRFNT